MWQKTNGLVFSDWTERFLAVLVRNVPGPQVHKKSQNCLEIGKWVSRNWWSEIISSRKHFPFGFYMFYNRSHTGEIMLNMQLRELYMNLFLLENVEAFSEEGEYELVLKF